MFRDKSGSRDASKTPVEDQLRLLSQIAAGAPKPTYLWVPFATEALMSEDMTLKKAALNMLAPVPHAWEAILEAGVSTPDPDFQAQVVRTLAAQARASEAVVPAFEAAAGLPGWLPETRAGFEAALGELTGAPAPVQDEPAEAAEDEEEAIAPEPEAVAGLPLKDRPVRLVTAVLLAAAVMAVSLPAGWFLGSRSTARVEAPAPVAEAPRSEAGIEEARAEGYTQALGALADQATALERNGFPYPALALWQSYAHLAPPGALAAHGRERSESLIAELRPAAADWPAEGDWRPSADAGEAPVQGLPAPIEPPIDYTIPDHIREKF